MQISVLFQKFLQSISTISVTSHTTSVADGPSMYDGRLVGQQVPLESIMGLYLVLCATRAVRQYHLRAMYECRYMQPVFVVLLRAIWPVIGGLQVTLIYTQIEGRYG